MLKGEIAFTPKGALASTVLGPGQSLSIGIGANGFMLPPSSVSTADPFKSIEAEIEASGDITGVSSTADDPVWYRKGGEMSKKKHPPKRN